MIPQTPALRSEINVTPFVDVCLVLLIIFMVITPLISQGPRVELPETNRPSTLAQGATLLTLRADGSLDLAGLAVAPERLPAELERLHADGKRLAVRADRKLAYRQVREVLAAASRAKFAGAELVTARRPQR